MQSTKFKIGDMIRLKDDPTEVGIVCESIDPCEEDYMDVRIWAEWNGSPVPAWASEDEIELVYKQDQWEYKEIKMNYFSVIVDIMNTEGKEGWELIMVSPHNDYTLILKRKVNK